ncbi:receptor-interacting serine/threonine-protein kinase 3 [Etheostoma spectabile]|uniref:receptor-interacting serine/threonine-protein kinase 3 n=1 Tax=Etheostoma spectabile TaxID=54343 RepID=UPI0013AEBF70|nr:receptor-interacting serine/threonine-protein kinase 3-like [Etheostoma spectabile]XP_032364277.1 receptor-interacting serine/threonine-protein kinase 3-like [Etheostoma spectabile]
MEQVVEDSSLRDWEVIGSGGFGQIYKARHRQWGCDVAVKLLLQGQGTEKSLLREIKMMRQAPNPYVMAVRGIFKGQTPSGGSRQLGVVMDLMETGSLASLQEALEGPPPWPLVFRLAHQVALGINFLHTLPRPVLHQDLKPQNVLLDDALNVKITDFGLARISCSVTQVSKDSETVGGTYAYMPPEAFDLSYKPTRAFDIYSYGILLWSIATGKQPYEYAIREMIKLRIPEGDRPLPDDIRGDAAGLTELKRLMERCWDQEPERRPRALECATEIEQLFKMHKDAISDAVYEVQNKLKQGMAAGNKDPFAEDSVEGIQSALGEVALLAVDPVRAQRRDLMRYVCELELDTNTVHRHLKLSDNNRKVTRVREYQPYPDHPERFDSWWPQLLCRDGLTGRCYWEVQRRGRVEISVSYRGIRRKGNSRDCLLGCNGQSWSLYCSDDRGYSVCHNTRVTVLPSSSVSNRVAVYVDCPAGSLSFYTVSSDSLIHLHTFNTTFTQPLYPGFMVWSVGSSVSLCPL